jgi:hypothetical protein
VAETMIPQPRRGACAPFADPNQTVATSSHVWHPAQRGSTLEGTATRHTPQSTLHKGIDFLRLPTLSRLFIDVDGLQIAVLRSGCRELVLRIVGDSILEGPVELSFRIDGLDGISRAARTIPLANELLLSRTQVVPRPGQVRTGQSGSGPSGPVPSHYRRLRHALVALAGSLAGVRQREIAAAMFGHDIAEAAWRENDLSYKQRTRRAIQYGRLLSAGHYRTLLR